MIHLESSRWCLYNWWCVDIPLWQFHMDTRMSKRHNKGHLCSFSLWGRWFFPLCPQCSLKTTINDCFSPFLHMPKVYPHFSKVPVFLFVSSCLEAWLQTHVGEVLRGGGMGKSRSPFLTEMKNVLNFPLQSFKIHSSCLIL